MGVSIASSLLLSLFDDDCELLFSLFEVCELLLCCDFDDEFPLEVLFDDALSSFFLLEALLSELLFEESLLISDFPPLSSVSEAEDELPLTFESDLSDSV